MTRPETCGAAGGAVALWVKMIVFAYMPSIISSHKAQYSGFFIDTVSNGNVR